MGKKSESFTSAVVEIEKILQLLEEGDIDPDTLANHVKRASELIKYCNHKIKKTQEEVDTILNDLE